MQAAERKASCIFFFEALLKTESQTLWPKSGYPRLPPIGGLEIGLEMGTLGFCRGQTEEPLRNTKPLIQATNWRDPDYVDDPMIWRFLRVTLLQITQKQGEIPAKIIVLHCLEGFV